VTASRKKTGNIGERPLRCLGQAAAMSERSRKPRATSRPVRWKMSPMAVGGKARATAGSNSMLRARDARPALAVRHLAHAWDFAFGWGSPRRQIESLSQICKAGALWCARFCGLQFSDAPGSWTVGCCRSC
jgi:hypothetical protein